MKHHNVVALHPHSQPCSRFCFLMCQIFPHWRMDLLRTGPGTAVVHGLQIWIPGQTQIKQRTTGRSSTSAGFLGLQRSDKGFFSAEGDMRIFVLSSGDHEHDRRDTTPNLVAVTCGSMSGVYDLRRGSIKVQSAADGTVMFDSSHSHACDCGRLLPSHLEARVYVCLSTAGRHNPIMVICRPSRSTWRLQYLWSRRTSMRLACTGWSACLCPVGVVSTRARRHLPLLCAHGSTRGAWQWTRTV